MEWESIACVLTYRTFPFPGAVIGHISLSHIAKNNNFRQCYGLIGLLSYNKFRENKKPSTKQFNISFARIFSNKLHRW